MSLTIQNFSISGKLVAYAEAPPKQFGFSTPAAMNGVSTAGYMYGVAVNSSGKFVAIGTVNNAFDLGYATSTDGITWTSPALMPSVGGGIRPRFRKIAVTSGGVFLTCGYDGVGSGTYFSHSTDGSTWVTPVKPSGIPSYCDFRAIAVNSSGLCVAAGTDASYAAFSSTSTPANDNSWVYPVRPTGTLMNGGVFTAIAVNSSGKFAAVGTRTSDGVFFYSASTNGTTWDAITISGTVCNFKEMAVNSTGKFVAVGNNASNYPMYSTSSDGGATWSTPAAMNGSTTVAYMQSVAVNSADKFVAVGYDGNNYPVYATSVDGSTWTTPARMNDSTTIAYMQGVAVNSADKFAAVGFNTNNYPVAAYSSN
jgi:hypothetical protein